MIAINFTEEPTRKELSAYANSRGRKGAPCVWCGQPVTRRGKSDRRYTREHVTPISLGGEREWTNIVTACAGCNHRRSSMPLLMFLVMIHKERELGRHLTRRERRELGFFKHESEHVAFADKIARQHSLALRAVEARLPVIPIQEIPEAVGNRDSRASA